jgi:hypothetical protein
LSEVLTNWLNKPELLEPITCLLPVVISSGSTCLRRCDPHYSPTAVLSTKSLGQTNARSIRGTAHNVLILLQAHVHKTLHNNTLHRPSFM